MRGLTYRTALLALLGLNVAVVAGVAAAFASGVRFERPAPAPTSAVVEVDPQGQPPRLAPPDANAPSARAFFAALPAERRAAIRAEISAAVRAARLQRQEARAARQALAEVAQDDTYDEAAVRAAFARQRAADGALMEKIHDVLATSLAKLTPDERRAAIQAATRMAQDRPLPLAGQSSQPQGQGRPLRERLQENGQYPRLQERRQRLEEEGRLPPRRPPPPPPADPAPQP
ncbi:MAG: periplasmic heavy metal sensor [Caulobacterales bacterium]